MTVKYTKSILILSITTALIFIYSCSSDTPSMPPTPVIDGWFDSDGHPVVIFTVTISPEGESGTLDDKMVQWGRVAITDGSDTAVMTSGLAEGLFPPHRYYTTSIIGEPGKTYTIIADYRTMHATATAFMPHPTPIDSISMRPVEGNDTLRSLDLHFTAPEDVPAYYYVTVSNADNDSRALPAMLGNTAALIAGEHIQIPIFMPKDRINTEHYEAQPVVGDRLTINLNRVEKPVYDFWRDFDNMIMFGNSQFISSTASLSSNINGGFGIWSPQGSSSIRVAVK